jgi:peptidoglycan/xylan/chitin deacetylase (PgdA/CDA1 family)
MSTSDKPSSKKSTFFHRLDVRFPWLKLATICLIVLIAIIDLFDFTISRVKDPYDQIKIAPMAYHVRITKRVLDGSRMLVALTFDDGPSAATTPELLDILYREDVPATFFMLGNLAEANPDIVIRAQKEGHIVASHTMYHQNLIRISTAAVQEDIDEANAVFSSILGHVPTLTRPPYGNYNSTIASIMGTPIILWSVDTLDWKYKSVDSIIEIALSQVHDGAIILMHDIHPTSVEAVPSLISILRESGYEFVTIPELAKMRGIDLVSGEAYRNIEP